MMNFSLLEQIKYEGINVKMTSAGTVATYAFTKKSLKKIRFVSRDSNS